MIVPWVQVYSNLREHPKTGKLTDELGLKSSSVEPDTIAVGMLVGIWSWAIQNAYSGDLSDCSDRLIAKAAGWKGKPAALLSALKNAGFLDEDMHLHDWEEYAMLLINSEDERKANDKKRAKAYRDRKRTECDSSRDASRDDHVTERDASRPYQTIPDQTIPEQTDNSSNISSYLPAGARAPAREESAAVREFDPKRDALADFYSHLPEGDYRLRHVKAVTAVWNARSARNRGDEACAQKWVDIALASDAIKVDRDTLEYE